MLLDLRTICSSLLAFCYFGIFVSAHIPRPRGVALSEAGLYAPADTFTCLDGIRTLKYEQVNDDFCDCLDGSDEPGTAACPNGNFHCENTGFKSLIVPSSRVNDGICDCCDGSDEYGSQVECANNCDELGQEERQRQRTFADLLKRGSLIRSEMSTKGKALKEEHGQRLNTIQQSIEQAQALKEERELIKAAAEKQETAALDVYKQATEAEKQRQADAIAQETRAEAEATFTQFDSNGDGVIEISEITTRVQFDSNRDGQVDVDEAKYFLDQQEQVDLETFVTVAWPRMKPYLMLDAGLFKPPAKAEEIEMTEGVAAPAAEEDVQGEKDEADGETAELVDEDEETETFEEEETGEGEVQQVDSTPSEPEYDDETKRLIEEATKARNEFDAAQRELRDLEAEKRQIEELLNKDYGPHEEFAVLNGECFEFEDREYIYRLCPFDRAVQKPKDGSETRLGGWDRWDGKPNKYSTMVYANGAGCWNGPQRSTIVELSCGLDTRITAVSEPNRCEYLFKFETPAACVQSSHGDAGDTAGGVHDEL